MNTVVLGAGIAGLGYLYNFKNQDNIYVYEKSNRPGGLCKSFVIDGFTFDSAVHLSFTESDIARRIFDKTNYIKHEPLAYSFYEGRYIKHPLINNLYSFPPLQKCKYIEDFLERDKNQEIKNYANWLSGSYGNAIKEDFYDKYTLKYWRVKSKALSTTWIGPRLQNPDIHKILMGSFSEKSGIDYYAKEMRYPVYGGYESFINPLIKEKNIICNKEAIKIDPVKKKILFKDNERISYDKLVSSLPICNVINMIDNVPSEVSAAAKNLKYTKISLVSIGFRKADIAKHLWMYIYDKDIMAARVNSPSCKSPNNVPNGCSSLQFEIYHGNWEKVDREHIVENTMYTIRKMKICTEKDIKFVDYKLLPFGNVIFYTGMEKDRHLVTKYLRDMNIQLIGRFGKWDYLWSDQSLLDGMNVVKKI